MKLSPGNCPVLLQQCSVKADGSINRCSCDKDKKIDYQSADSLFSLKLFITPVNRIRQRYFLYSLMASLETVTDVPSFSDLILNPKLM